MLHPWLRSHIFTSPLIHRAHPPPSYRQVGVLNVHTVFLGCLAGGPRSVLHVSSQTDACMSMDDKRRVLVVRSFSSFGSRMPTNCYFAMLENGNR